jgi:DNA (cytosine-5)-methyltransferase 1
MPHSQAGKRRGKEDERDLWPRTLEVADEVDAGLFFIENVSGLLTHTHEDERFMQDLDEQGWNAVYDHYPAPLVGATQPRRRVFLLAYRRDHGLPQFGTPHHDDWSDEAGNVSDRCLAPFPPGPQDARGWSEYLRTATGPQPGLCRNADGFHGRVDRVRILGNACLPVQVGVAFLDLLDRLRAKAEDDLLS